MITRILSRLALVTALVVALAIPSLYLTITLRETKKAMRTETAFTAKMIEQIISQRPEMWMYETIRLLEIASQPTTEGKAEERILHDLAGTVLVRTDYTVRPPVLVSTIPLFDYGRPVGSVTARRSMLPIAATALILAVAGLSLGAFVIFLFQTYPLRLLAGALATISEEKRKSEATLKAIGDGVIAVDNEEKVVLLNRAAEELLGWTAAEARGKPVGDIYVVRPEEKRAKAGPEKNGILASRNGIERTIEETTAPIIDETGRNKGTVIVFRDITERIRTEEELLRARQLESIGILAGGIAHDFNNYLAGIMMNISLAKIHATGNEKALARLVETEKATMLAHELAKKLLTFSKGGTPLRKTIALGELVEETARFSVRGSSVTCSCQAPPELWNAEADPGQITQVISNIVINAVQAIGGSGEIRIGMENALIAEKERIHVAPGRYVLIRIEDSGPGFPQEVLPRIFDPYFTTKPKGSGLGLAICYSIMKAHGGNIFAGSAPGRGAVFTLYLPATDKAVPGVVNRAEADSAKESGRILLMDDDTIIRESLQAMLAYQGYDVESSLDGAEAIEKYTRAADGQTPFDVVIMDLTIPGGMGGKDTAAKLLSRYPDARIIVSSGYSNDPLLADPGKYGCAAAVGKPYKTEELRRTLRAVLAGGVAKATSTSS